MNVPTELVWPCFAAALLAVAAASWFAARRRFLCLADALVRLDEIGRTHNRLTAAHEGVGDWPGPREIRDPVRWCWPRLLAPVSLSAVLLAGAAWLPVASTRHHEYVRQQPLAWTEVESWLQTVEEAKLVEPEAIAKAREQLDHLREQPPDDWYKQSSLEAGDTLRDQTEQALRRTLEQLEKTERILAVAEKSRETLASGQLKALNDSLQNSLHDLDFGNLPLNKELLSDLKKLDSDKLKQLPPAQLKEMRARVQAGMQVAEKCVRPGANIKNTLFAEDSENGGPGGGGGPAPLVLKEHPTDLRTKQTETIFNNDVSHALPARLVGLEAGDHEVDTAQIVEQVAGGSVASAGEGGDAVRRDSFTPEEQEILQRFFR